jgi:uncharacterized protein YgbK (DUF1537 family)
VQRALGAKLASETIEQALAAVALGVVGAGVVRLVVAGGETWAAVVRSLELRLLEVGDDVEPGVPWLRPSSGPQLTLALKSGNFGSDAFLVKALGLES